MVNQVAVYMLAFEPMPDRGFPVCRPVSVLRSKWFVGRGTVNGGNEYFPVGSDFFKAVILVTLGSVIQ